MTPARSVPRRSAGRARTVAGRPRAVAGRRRSASSRPARSSARRSRGTPWWPLVLVAFAVITVLAWQADATPAPAVAPGRCTVPGAGITLSPEQADNARTIARVADERGLPRRALVIALATAQQESKLRNLPYGDRDSVGLFQQRPSQGWGTTAQILDPAYATGKFFDHLVLVSGWQTARLTDAAQAVQRSAAAEAYQRWEPLATSLAAALESSGGAGLRCGD